MKTLKLLNSLFILIFFLIFFQSSFKVYANEPVDIWSLDKNLKESKEPKLKIEQFSTDEDDKTKINIKSNKTKNKFFKEENLSGENILLVGLYDPEDNGLNINMWSNSNGEEIKSILYKIEEKKLSRDSKNILETALLTNAYFPEKNITFDEFLNFQFNYLIKNNDLDLIKNYIIKNAQLPNISILVKHYVNEYLSNSELEKACSIFNEFDLSKNEYLTKFKIYCLIYDEKFEKAQLIYDLLNETSFEEPFFEKKFNFLMGYEKNDSEEISEKNILDFHLSHITNKNFLFTPNQLTSKHIWKYLSSSNLLENVDLIDLEDYEKIKIIEKATHEKNYTEDELFDLYKRFQFSINQLINVKNTYKLLPTFEGRALLYQRLLLTIDINEKLDLSLKLKQSFKEDEIENAFNDKLYEILKEIKLEDVPSNYSTFYQENIFKEKNIKKKIKYNNKIIHQSKLINYFLNDSNITKAEKDANDLLKKIKKDKKYIFTSRDIMMIESLKSDGVKISSKFNNLYEADPDIPPDIQVKINNYETGLVLLRLVEIIGEDDLESLGSESLNFMVNVLNQLNMDKLRNEILVKILPLRI